MPEDVVSQQQLGVRERCAGADASRWRRRIRCADRFVTSALPPLFFGGPFTSVTLCSEEVEHAVQGRVIERLGGLLAHHRLGAVGD